MTFYATGHGRQIRARPRFCGISNSSPHSKRLGLVEVVGDVEIELFQAVPLPRIAGISALDRGATSRYRVGSPACSYRALPGVRRLCNGRRGRRLTSPRCGGSGASGDRAKANRPADGGRSHPSRPAFHHWEHKKRGPEIAVPGPHGNPFAECVWWASKGNASRLSNSQGGATCKAGAGLTRPYADWHVEPAASPFCTESENRREGQRAARFALPVQASLCVIPARLTWVEMIMVGSILRGRVMANKTQGQGDGQQTKKRR